MVLLVLVIMPAISVYFMSKGTSLHTGLLAQLNDYGVVKSTLPLDKKISVLSVAIPESKNYEYQRSRVFQAFHDDANIQLLTFVKGNDSLSTVYKNEKVYHIDSVNIKDELESLRDKAPGMDCFILVDTLSHIRNVYPIKDSSEVNRMITHILKIRPAQTKATLEAKEYKEK